MRLSAARHCVWAEQGREESREVAGDFAVAGHQVAPGGPGGLPACRVRVPAEPEQGDPAGRRLRLGPANRGNRIEPAGGKVQDRGRRPRPEGVTERFVRLDGEGAEPERVQAGRDPA